MTATSREVAFERYVNFEFYKTVSSVIYLLPRLRDM